MITDALVGAVLSLFHVVMGAIPQWNFPEPSLSAATAIGRGAQYINVVIPVPDLVLMIGFGITLSLVLGAFHLAMWIYHNIPVFGGSS